MNKYNIIYCVLIKIGKYIIKYEFNVFLQQYFITVSETSFIILLEFFSNR